jgi:hypothetical protein
MNKLLLTLGIFFLFAFKSEVFRCIKSQSFRQVKNDNVTRVEKPFSACWGDEYFSFTHPDLGITTFKIADKRIDELANGQVMDTFMNAENETTHYGFYAASVIYGNEKKSLTISFTRSNMAYMIESKDFSVATNIGGK